MSTKKNLENIPAQRTRRFAARLEPLIQANRVELLLASAALHLRQLKISTMNDRIADSALFDAGELLVDVALPDLQALTNRAVLVAQVSSQLEQPISPLVLANADALYARHFHHAEWIVHRQLYDELHAKLLHLVGRYDLACTQHAADFYCRLFVVVFEILFRFTRRCSWV